MRGVSLTLAALSLLFAEWTQVAPMPPGEAGGAAAWLGGELVLAGGTTWVANEKHFLRTTQIYTPGADRWRTGPDLPSAMAYGPFVSSTDGLEVFGGTDGAGAVRESFLLKPPFTHWTRSGSVPADVLLGSATLVGDSVYLMGGCPDAADLTRCSDAVWRRDAKGGWKQISRLPQGRLALQAAAPSGSNIIIFGGCSMTEGRVLNHNQVWSFDTANETWEQAPALPASVRGLTAVALNRTQIVLLGGYTDAGFSDAVLLYDVRTREYKTLRRLPLPVMGAAAVLAGKQLYIAGGEDKARSRSSKVFRAELLP